MTLTDDLRNVAANALTAGVAAARGQGVALAGDFETLIRPQLFEIVAQIGAITQARIDGTIGSELAQLNLKQQFGSIEDLAITEAELALQAVQSILQAVVDALRAAINVATSHAIGVALL
jgi:hypothetical protein